jgi:hypothetical protein
MKAFEQLGSLTERLWREVHCDEYAFPNIATRALAETPPIEAIEPFEVVNWLLE